MDLDDLLDERHISYAVRIARAVYALAEGRMPRRRMVVDIRLVWHAYARVDHPAAEEVLDRIERARDRGIDALWNGLPGHAQRRLAGRQRRRAGYAVRLARRLARAWLRDVVTG
jgi:hypothetical protein